MINMKDGLVVVSLFDGCAMACEALKRAGFKVKAYYASEIDKPAMKIAMKNHPDIIQMGDVTKLEGWMFPEKIDLLIGGSPCQGFSFAGKQLNFDDPRSKLFFEYVRLLEELKPTYFVLENVNMKKEFRDFITEKIGVEPINLDSNLVSAQDRDRFYWTSIRGVSAPLPKGLVIEDIILPWETIPEKYWYSYPLFDIDMSKKVCAKMDFKNQEMHRRIYNPLFTCGTLTTCGGGNTQKKVMQNGRARKPTPIEYERLQTLPDNYTEGVAETHRYNMLGNGYTGEMIVHILSFIYLGDL